MMDQASAECPVEPMESEDPSFMLYTSGSTGKPKGIQHSTAGYLVYSSFTHQVSDSLTSDPRGQRLAVVAVHSLLINYSVKQ